MKIVLDNEGGLCNKLWSIVNPIIWSVKNKKRTLFISYDINYRYFPKFFFNKYLWFPLIYTNHSIGYRLVSKLYINFKKHKESHPINERIWFGWDSIYDEIKADDRKIIRRIFKPSKSILSKIEKKFQEERSKDIIIIGIHIRRGDYAYFENGRFFYNISVYKDVMRKLKKKFRGKVKFFISSNELINPEDFSEFSFFYFGERAIVDLYALSICDYIIGPPSTFSMWAALYGGNLQSFIMHKGQSQFKFNSINKNISLEELDKIYG